MLEEIIIRVPPTRNLANLGIPCKLRIVAFECPKTIGPHGVAPHLLCLLAPVLHSINVLPEPPISFLRVFHQLQYQVFRKFHDETHFPSLLFSSLPIKKQKSPNLMLQNLNYENELWRRITRINVIITVKPQ